MLSHPCYATHEHSTVLEAGESLHCRQSVGPQTSSKYLPFCNREANTVVAARIVLVSEGSCVGKPCSRKTQASAAEYLHHRPGSGKTGRKTRRLGAVDTVFNTLRVSCCRVRLHRLLVEAPEINAVGASTALHSSSPSSLFPHRTVPGPAPQDQQLCVLPFCRRLCIPAKACDYALPCPGCTSSKPLQHNSESTELEYRWEVLLKVQEKAVSIELA